MSRAPKKPMAKTYMRAIVAEELVNRNLTNMSKTAIMSKFREVNLDYPQDTAALSTRSYLAYGRESKRRRVKMGKLLAKVIPMDSDVCHAVESLKSKIYPTELTVIEQRGEDILESYFEGMAADASSSCMTGSYGDYDMDRYHLLDLYANNPEKISLLIFKLGSASARALAWRGSKNGYSYLDRIYSSRQEIKNLVFEYGKANFDFCRDPYDNTYDCKAKMQISRSDIDDSFILNGVDEYFPYADTFRYGLLLDGVRSGKIEVFVDFKNEYVYSNKVVLFDSTSGECYRMTNKCGECGSHQARDYMRSDGSVVLCRTCYSEKYTDCPNCSRTALKSKVVTVDGLNFCENCVSHATFKCDTCGDRHVNDKTCIIVKSDAVYKVCTDCLPAGYFSCECCNSYSDSKEMFYINGNKYCSSCIKNKSCYICGTITGNYSYVGEEGQATKVYECGDCFRNACDAGTINTLHDDLIARIAYFSVDPLLAASS